MAKRNTWADHEVVVMLQILKEKKIMQHLDGKRFKTTEIYSLVEDEMKKAGFQNKSAEQIKIKWKKLKGEYVACKKSNLVSGAARSECKFFDLLEELLEDRPVVQLISGFDSSEASCQSPVTIEVDPCILAEDIDSITNSSFGDETLLTTPSARVLSGVQSRKNKPSSSKVEEWKIAQKELQEDFFKKQQELMTNHLNEEKKVQLELNEKMQTNLDKSLTGIAKIIMDGISTIFGNAAQNNSTQATATQHPIPQPSPEITQLPSVRPIHNATTSFRMHPYNIQPSHPISISVETTNQNLVTSPSPSSSESPLTVSPSGSSGCSNQSENSGKYLIPSGMGNLKFVSRPTSSTVNDGQQSQPGGSNISIRSVNFPSPLAAQQLPARPLSAGSNRPIRFIRLQPQSPTDRIHTPSTSFKFVTIPSASSFESQDSPQS